MIKNKLFIRVKIFKILNKTAFKLEINVLKLIILIKHFIILLSVINKSINLILGNFFNINIFYISFNNILKIFIQIFDS